MIPFGLYLHSTQTLSVMFRRHYIHNELLSNLENTLMLTTVAYILFRPLNAIHSRTVCALIACASWHRKFLLWIFLWHFQFESLQLNMKVNVTGIKQKYSSIQAILWQVNLIWFKYAVSSGFDKMWDVGFLENRMDGFPLGDSQ